MIREPAKPTGSSGIVVVSASPELYERLVWPKSKCAIEDMIVKRAINCARSDFERLYGLSCEPARDPTNDFDFILRSRTSEEYLDLVEFVPVRGTANPYPAQGWYIVGDRAEALWDTIHAKDEHYGARRRAVVHLLVYVTDWSFHLSSEVLDLVAFWCAGSRKHEFQSIACFQADAGEFVQLFPCKARDFSGFDEVAVKKRQVLLADPRAATIDPAGGVSIPIRGPANRPEHGVTIWGGTTIFRGKSDAGTEPANQQTQESSTSGPPKNLDAGDFSSDRRMAPRHRSNGRGRHSCIC